MIFLHEVHRVDGRREDDFEAAWRDDWLPALASLDGARLLYFLHHAHGSGASYRVVTITALRDAGAFGRLAESVAAGELRPLAERLDTLRHDTEGKLLRPLPWSPLQSVDLDGAPDAPDHDPTVFMEDTVWPREGLLERYVEASGSHYAREMTERESEGGNLIQIQASFRTVHGAGRRGEIVLWQKVAKPRWLSGLLSSEVPERFKRPGTWMHDALEWRDQWESRLLRTARWSPLY